MRSVLAMAVFAAATAVLVVTAQNTGSPVFQVNLQVAVYTSANVMRSSSSNKPQFVAADWLNPPYETVAYDQTGAVVWSDTTSANKSEMISIRSTAARFIEPSSQFVTAPSGTVSVDVVTAMEEQGEVTEYYNCVIYGMSSRAVGPTSPQWTYVVPACAADFVDSTDMLKLSDDGSTLALLIWTNQSLPDSHLSQSEVDALPLITGPRGGAFKFLQARILNGQTGAYMGGADVSNVMNSNAVSRGISISATGQYVAITTGGNTAWVTVLDTVTGGKVSSRCPPVSVGLTMATTISPAGDALIAGYSSVGIWKWSSSANTYKPGWTESWPGYALYASTYSSNNGKPRVAAGWINGQATQAAVSMYDAVTGTNLWEWYSPLNQEDQNIVSYMSAHLNYVAVATWGSGNEAANPSPQVLLFNDQSNSTLLSYITPGSMFQCDMIVDQVGNTGVWVVAAGKHVPANEMGNGGDLFVFNVPT